jgi:iron complex outermembrane receptor protein
MRILFSAITCLFFLQVMAQDCIYTFQGKVIDSHDNSALVGATVILAGVEQAVQTNVDGEFTFSNLCIKEYAFQVSHPYCTTKGYTVKINGNTNKTFYLEHHLEELNEVTISGNGAKSFTKTANEIIIKKATIDNFSSKSLADLLETVSGVSKLSTGNSISKPIINGLHSSRVVIINDGSRLKDQEWGIEHAPNMDVNAINTVTVIKGANGLKYSGDAIGGMILTESNKIPVKDTIYGNTILSLHSNGRGGTVSSNLTKSSESGFFTSAQGTVKRFGDFNAPDYNLSNTGFFERDISLKVGLNKFNYGVTASYSFFKSTVGILRASHLGGATDQIAAISSPEPLFIDDFTHTINNPKQDVTHQVYRLNAFKKFNKLGKLNVQYNYQINKRFEFDIRRGDDKDKPSIDLELSSHNLLLDLETKLNDSGMLLKTGVSFSYENNFANPETGVRRLIPDYDAYEAALYGIFSTDLSEKLTFELGSRLDIKNIDAFKFYRTSFWELRNYDELFSDLVIQDLGNQVLVNANLTFINFSGATGLFYKIDENQFLKLNYGLASRAPNASELFSEGLHHSASRIEYGDLRFKSEVSHKVAFNYERKGDKLTFNFNPFVQFVNRFKVLEPTSLEQTTRGNFQVWSYRETDAKLYGLDLDVTYHFLENLSVNQQFALVKGYDDVENPLINLPPASLNNTINYNIKKLKNINITLQNNYVFRQNEFPDTNFDTFVPVTQTFQTVDLTTPPEAYFFTNFKASMPLNLSNKTLLNVSLFVDNVFNTTYRNYLNRFRYYADDLGRNISIQLKLNY